MGNSLIAIRKFSDKRSGYAAPLVRELSIILSRNQSSLLTECGT